MPKDQDPTPIIKAELAVAAGALARALALIEQMPRGVPAATHTSPEPRAPPQEAPLVLRPKQAAQLLAVKTTTLYALMNSGEIASFRRGQSRFILTASIQDYLDRQLIVPPAAITSPNIALAHRASARKRAAE